MQICFIEDTQEFGGGQEWAYDTIKELIKHGHKINLIIPYNNFKFIDKSLKLKINIFTYNWEKIPHSQHLYSSLWIKALKNSDIALCSVLPPRNNFHCIKYAAECIKKSGNRTVLIPKTGTIVSTYIREYYLPDPTIKTKIITITKFTKNALINNFNIPPHKIKTIHQGTNPEKFTTTEFSRQQSALRYGAKNDSIFTIGVVGKYEIRKGHTVLLEAIKEIITKYDLNINASFLGEGPLLDSLKNKVFELNLINNIKFYPFTDEPQFFYDSIDTLALPSLYKEGLPNVLLEAMLMKKPCIASKLAGTSEVIKPVKTGLLVEPGNIKELSEAILKLIRMKRSKFEKLGENSRNFILSNFDRKKQAVKFLEFFQQVSKKRKTTDTASID